MSEFENTQGFDFDTSFLDLVESSSARDRGISLFEERMLAAEVQLRGAFAKTKSGFDSSLASSVEQELNENWGYHEEVATVSGRVYLADPELEDIVPEGWGESNVDEGGRVFYYLDNVSLKSHGVEAIPDFADDDEQVSGVRMGYIFSIVDDAFERPIFTAYIGELSKHFYAYPTVEESAARLDRQWPEELEVVNLLLKPKKEKALAERIAMTARQLQECLQASEEFRDLMTIYINGRLSLDENLPYIATVKDRISYFDGKDVSAADAEHYWVHVKTNESITLPVFDPQVHFFQNSDGTYDAHIFASTYNSEDGDEPEYVSLRVEDITQFKGTRAIRSIAARAFLGAKSDEDNFDGIDISRRKITSSKNRQKQRERTPSQYENGTPLYIKAMETFLRQLDEIAEELRIERRKVYTNANDAREAAVAFINTFIVPRFEEVGLSSNFELEASGSSVIRPRFQQETPPKGSEHLLLVGVDDESPWIPMTDGDSLTGSPRSIEAFYREERDAQDAVVGYSILPGLLVELPSTKANAFDWQGVSVAGIRFDASGVIPLDGSAQVRIKPLEHYTEMTQAFRRASETHTRQPVLKQLQTMQRQLFTEIPGRYKNMEDVRAFPKIARAINQLHAEGKDTTALLGVLDTMFVDRKIQIGGDLYASREGVYVHVDSTDDEDLIVGQVIDVNNQVIEGKVTFMIESNGAPLIAVPLESITRFHF
jgi:hypothetical protein